MVRRSLTFAPSLVCHKICVFCNIDTHPLNLGVRVEYLPPYSPNLNPIEECFSKIKHFLRRHCDYYSQTTGDGILFDMFEVTEIITPTDAAGYFWHAGYI